jgi:hypothetical protein
MCSFFKVYKLIRYHIINNIRISLKATLNIFADVHLFCRLRALDGEGTALHFHLLSSFVAGKKIECVRVKCVRL